MTVRYKASEYLVMKGIGTNPLQVAMEVKVKDMKAWIGAVGKCFELSALSYERETQTMTATFRPGNGLALIAEVLP